MVTVIGRLRGAFWILPVRSNLSIVDKSLVLLGGGLAKISIHSLTRSYFLSSSIVLISICAVRPITGHG